MREITVPMMSRKMEIYGGNNAMLEQVKRMGAKRVLLATDTLITDRSERDAMIELLKENVAFYKSHGLEVGVWTWSTWITGPLSWTPMRGINGRFAGPHMCPFDPGFCNFVGEYVEEYAQCGVDLILFDDDFKYGFYENDDTLYCLCPYHMARINEMIGETLTPEELQAKALKGGKNKYRTAFLKANGDGLRHFAKVIREHVNKVNPNVRVGVCSEMSLWDYCGVDSEEIARILAGDTKPFLRLIGAPYWGVKQGSGRNNLQNVFELERMERSWIKSTDMEILCEGDVYPRPRYHCPSAYLELFDLAMIATDKFSGILKYPLDYTTKIDYELGYVDRHVRNLPLQKEVDAAFKGKSSVGMRIWDVKNKIENCDIPPEREGNGNIQHIFFSPAGKMCSNATVPTTYEGEGVCNMAFGENIKYVPREALKKGIIIDYEAARCLAKMGIDTGIKQDNGSLHVTTELFLKSEYRLHHYQGWTAHNLTLDEKAVVDSTFVLAENLREPNKVQIPASFYYENAEGDKFFVFCFDMYFNNDNMMRTYARSRQIAEACEKLSGNKLPAYIYGNPDMYIMASEDQREFTVGIWNIFADSAFAPVVELGKSYEGCDIRFINCTGKLDGDKVILSDMLPYSFAGFVITK